MQAKKNILYLSYDGLTDPLGQSQILPYVEGLSGIGYAFTIISFEKPDRYKSQRASIEVRCAAQGIQWVPLTYTKRPPVLSTLYDVNKLHRKAEDLMLENAFDLIHCRSYITSLAALRIKKKWGIPFIFDMRGFWADERVDGGIWNLKNPIYRLIYRYFKRKEKAFLQQASAVVSLTHAGKLEMESWLESRNQNNRKIDYYNFDSVLALRRKTAVIPCATDLSLFTPAAISKNKKKWLAAVHGIDLAAPYLGYVGSLGTWYLPEEMLNFYAALLKAHPKLKFLLLTHDDPSTFYHYAASKGISPSQIVHIAAKRSEVPVLMSMMDTAVFYIKPAYSKIASSPTKQGELMAMGVPVFCNAGVGDTAAIIEKYEAGSATEDFSIPSVQVQVRNYPNLQKLDRAKIRNGAETYFSLEKAVESYRALYEQITQLK